ncbi:hypothetical protein FACS1894216_10230 [Synergistales bacterium]|nr:hypothetical protein FACS1894216_10230 [Synergistales bacterium]
MTENRAPAAPNAGTLVTKAAALSYRDLPATISNYISFRIPFRNYFTRQYVRIFEDGLSSYVKEYYKGYDGEFYPEGRDTFAVSNYLGLNSLPYARLCEARAYIAGLQAWWEARGVYFLCVMVQDKTTVYPELMPIRGRLEPRGVSWGESIADVMRDTPVNFIDMSKILIRHKGEYKTFNRQYDLYHWNAYGIYLTYRTLCEALAPVMSTAPRGGEFYRITEEEHNYDGIFDFELVPWMEILEQDKLKVLSSDIDADIIRNTAKRGGAMLVMGDSYFNATHLSKLSGADNGTLPFAHSVNTYIGAHYSGISAETMEFIHATYKPTVVIFEFVERMYPTLADCAAQNEFFVKMGDAYLNTPRSVNGENKFLLDKKILDGLYFPSSELSKR